MTEDEYTEQLLDDISLLQSCDAKQAYEALKRFIIISIKTPKLYPYMNIFIDMMNHTNSYIRTRGLRLIAYNAKWDQDNILPAIIDTYLDHIEDEKPITSRQCIKDTVMIARYKPELIGVILLALETYHKTYKSSMQSLIYKDRKQAIQLIRQI